MMEVAFAHGYQMATVPGFAANLARARAADERARGPVTRVASTGQANVAGWMELARMFPDAVVSGGDRLVH